MSDVYAGLRSSPRRIVKWTLVVKERTTGKRKIFSYIEERGDIYNSRINKIFALDNAINNTDFVTIKRWNDGSYSYPE